MLRCLHGVPNCVHGRNAGADVGKAMCNVQRCNGTIPGEDVEAALLHSNRGAELTGAGSGNDRFSTPL